MHRLPALRRLLLGPLAALVAVGCSSGPSEVVPPSTLPAELVAVMQSVLTPEGRELLYEARPTVLDKEAFSGACTASRELSFVLGCYRSGEIAILRVDRPELARVMEVTAAHEMLHAAYRRLSLRERPKVDGWIEEAFARMADAEVREVAGRYERQSPERRLDELHSILGTEVAVLTPALETYYQRYFAQRTRLVAAHESYEAVFRDMKKRVAALQSEMEATRAELGDLEKKIGAKRSELGSLNSQLDQHRAQGNARGHNALVPRQNAVLQEYDRLVDRFNQLVAVHDEKVRAIKELSVEKEELAESMGGKGQDRR